MAKLTPLSKERHAALGWRPVVRGRPPQGAHSIPVAQGELGKLCVRMPLVFQLSRSRADLCVPLNILAKDDKSFVTEDGYWALPTQPFDLLKAPFALAQTREEGYVLVDEDKLAPMAEGEAMTALFDTEGEFTPDTAAQLKALHLWGVGRQRVRMLAGDLATLQLLRPKSINGVTGYAMVDSKRLAAQKPGVLGGLAKSGALMIAHAAIISLNTLQTARKLTVQAASARTAQEEDTEALDAEDMAEAEAFLAALRSELG